MLSKLKNIWTKIVNLTTSKQQIIGQSIAVSESVKAKSKQDLIFWGFLALTLAIVLIWLQYRASNNDDVTSNSIDKAPLKLEIASQALDSEKMWRNYFEDKLLENNVKSASKLQLIENSINEQAIAQTTQLKTELEKLKAQLQYLTDEQAISKQEINNAKAKLTTEISAKNSDYILEETNITVNNMQRAEIFDRPKSMRSFIPETAYVKGVLLGGIAVSTSMGSSAEPVPVIIRITDRGNLPQNFNIDLTHCQIMGSSYGDLSSERAIVRAEILSCKDDVNELIYTTRIAGIIFGDDGMNGIKGKVVQTSGKHLKNAIIGGMVSGFAQSAKGQDQLLITSAGAVDRQKKGMGDLVKEGGFSGASNAAEKIADYYIKQAEAMSPVLLVSGGVRVDVVFTKGVYLGAVDIQEKLEQSRLMEKSKK